MSIVCTIYTLCDVRQVAASWSDCSSSFCQLYCTLSTVHFMIIVLYTLCDVRQVAASWSDWSSSFRWYQLYRIKGDMPGFPAPTRDSRGSGYQHQQETVEVQVNSTQQETVEVQVNSTQQETVEVQVTSTQEETAEVQVTSTQQETVEVQVTSNKKIK